MYLTAALKYERLLVCRQRALGMVTILVVSSSKHGTKWMRKSYAVMIFDGMPTTRPFGLRRIISIFPA